ncbi:hypothetical protein GCM10010260_46340 [Streptomyces filipinensis]|uniref:DUF3040 domain-containing protein n=1 Tax=Streptomyces filipinensis TaxID=66887 RepID=A0A918IFB7_9ACTN|nr:DUF3040 domain-containing protein [Streptomyces filipinensis]GGV04085.1 hypothetical protein GCM10010260_46340 [Streptomyces filipinensis]
MDDSEMDDWETWEMHDEARLSPRERLVLLQIESGLRQDRRFARSMGDGGRGRLLPAAVLLLSMASAFVAAMGIRTSDPALLCCFAFLWPLTLFQAFRLLCRLTRGRSRSGERVREWL